MESYPDSGPNTSPMIKIEDIYLTFLNDKNLQKKKKNILSILNKNL
jgi:hypothetical protein